MAHAVVGQVKRADGGNSEEGLRLLRERIIPNAKSQPGFQSGRWMNNGADGIGIVVFDTVEHATAAQEAMKPPPGGPQLVSSAVYEVAGEA